MPDRRTFLKGVLFTSTWRAFLAGPLGLAWSSPARAEAVTIVIAIASAVAGMIASNNAGGGGLGDFLNAINKKLDVAIDQLASLQEAISVVLQRLARLESDIDKLLRDDDIRKLHDLTYSAIIRYVTKIQTVRRNYASDDEFRKAPGTLEDIQSILNDLYSATAQLQAKQAYGPTTGMVIPAAFFLENSLLLLRGDKPADIAARLRSSIDWLDRVADPLIATSAATYRAQAVLRHQQFFRAASQNQLGKALAMKPGSALFECVSVTLRIHFTPFGDPGMSDHKQDAIFNNFTLSEKEYFAPVVVQGREETVSAGFLALYLKLESPSKVLPSGSPDITFPCPVNQIDVSVGSEDKLNSDRANWLRERLKNSTRNADFAVLQTLVDQINLERARISFATSSLTNVAKARSQMARMVKELVG